MRLFLIQILLLLFTIQSCTLNNNEKTTSFERIFKINTNSYNEPSLLFSDIFTNVNYIKLETKNDNLVSDFRRLYFHDDRLLIFTWDGLSVFDINGEYLFRLGKSGRAPGEFIDASDIFVDDETIEILDIFQKKVLRFDENGNFIDEFRYNDFFASSFFKLNNDTYAFYLGNRKNPDLFNNKHFNILIYKDGTIQNTFYPITSIKENLRFMPIKSFSKIENLTLFQDVFNDTIYKITNSKFIPYYYIDFLNNKINLSKYKKYKDDTNILINKIWDSGLSQLEYFDESEYFIIFTYINNKQRFIAIFSKISNNMKVFKGFINDFEGSQLSYPVLLKKDKLYFYYDAYDFLERYKKNESNRIITNSQYFDIITSLSISDNPIIIEAQITPF